MRQVVRRCAAGAVRPAPTCRSGIAQGRAAEGARARWRRAGTGRHEEQRGQDQCGRAHHRRVPGSGTLLALVIALMSLRRSPNWRSSVVMRVSSWAWRASRLANLPLCRVQPRAHFGQRIELLAHVTEPGRDGLAQLGDVHGDIQLQIGKSTPVRLVAVGVDHEPVDECDQQRGDLHGPQQRGHAGFPEDPPTRAGPLCLAL